MDKWYSARKCDCGNVMRILVDHDEHCVESSGCYLIFRGKLRIKVHMPPSKDLLVGLGRFVATPYINSVSCTGCLKVRRIKTFK